MRTRSRWSLDFVHQATILTGGGTSASFFTILLDLLQTVHEFEERSRGHSIDRQVIKLSIEPVSSSSPC